MGYGPTTPWEGSQGHILRAYGMDKSLQQSLKNTTQSSTSCSQQHLLLPLSTNPHFRQASLLTAPRICHSFQPVKMEPHSIHISLSSLWWFKSYLPKDSGSWHVWVTGRIKRKSPSEHSSWGLLYCSRSRSASFLELIKILPRWESLALKNIYQTWAWVPFSCNHGMHTYEMLVLYLSQTEIMTVIN